MRFSIIIKTLNEENNLKRLLNEIKNQTIKDYEIIVSDGLSTDGTLEIAKEYGCKIISSKDKNLGAAMNKGAKLAKGEVLVFPDADVKMPNDFLQKIDKALKEKNIVGGYFYNVAYDSIIANFLSYYPICIALPILKFFRLDAALGPAMFFKSDFFRKIGGFSEDVLLEDVEMFTKIRRLGYNYAILFPPIGVSARRFRKNGFIKQNLLYIKYWLDIKLGKKLKKNYHDVYSPIR